MKKSVLACLLGLMASSVYAEMKIEVCFVPLSEVVIDQLKESLKNINMHHVFMRGNDGTGLNFQAINPNEIFGGKAEIGSQNYPTAQCVKVFSTDDPAEYVRNLNNVKGAFKAKAAKYPYSIDEKNCQVVTDEVIREMGWPVPEELTSQLEKFEKEWQPLLKNLKRLKDVCSIQ